MKKSEAIESTALVGFLLLTSGAISQVANKLGDAGFSINFHGIFHMDTLVCPDGSSVKNERIIVKFNTPGDQKVRSVLPPASCESKG